jgi:hypothetical protein
MEEGIGAPVHACLKNEGFCNVSLPLKFSSAPLKPTPENVIR